MKCKICDKEFEKLNGFGLHLKFSHNLTNKEYYDKYLRKPGEGICPVCGKETTFRANWLYLKFCSHKCATQNGSWDEQKFGMTKSDFYKNVYKTQKESILDKTSKTCLEKYGVEKFSQSDVYKNKYKNTIKLKYNVDHFSKTKEFKDKYKSAMLNNWGVEHYSKTNTFKEQVSKKNKEFDSKYKEEHGLTFHEKIGLDRKNEYLEKFKDTIKNFVMVENIENFNIFYCVCKKCSNKFSMTKRTIEKRLNNNISICPKCFPYKNLMEYELYTYITTLYNNYIVYHDRNKLNGKELDIYLPDLKLAFEFDGTYWHADPRFYKSDDFIEKKKMFAKAIWEYDKQKDLLCEQNNIRLYRITEYDWTNDNKNVKQFIKDIIYESSSNS